MAWAASVYGLLGVEEVMFVVGIALSIDCWRGASFADRLHQMICPNRLYWRNSIGANGSFATLDHCAP